MSSDFYFKKWRNTLACLEEIVNSDNYYQITRAHDKRLCQATLRLSAVLSQYMAAYNNIMECINKNLQVQKTAYMMAVVNSVVSRILELKSDIRKLESSNCQYFGHGLVQHHLTTSDTEMLEVSTKLKRAVHIETMIEKSFERVKKKKESLECQADIEEVNDVKLEKVLNWWEKEDTSESVINFSDNTLEEQASEETLAKRGMIIVIQAHEKLRQVMNRLRHQKYKRDLWSKGLSGNAPPPPPTHQMRVKAAEFIQQVLRTYFTLKRKKIRDHKRDEILGLTQYEMRNTEALHNALKINEHRFNRLNKLKREYKESYDKRKLIYIKREGDSILEEWRDFVREWFKKWFNEMKIFHDIPNQNKGGIALIVKEELPSFNDWLEEYKRYIEENRMNKNKTAMQIKYEKMKAKRLKIMIKKEELTKKKQEKMLMERMMKNPNMHPGYYYPESKKTLPILKAIHNYKKDWYQLDNLESTYVKEAFLKEVQFNDICMEVKLESLAVIEEDMRNELKVLKTALKKDYLRNNEKMPEVISKSKKSLNRKVEIKKTLSQNIVEKMEELMMSGILKEYTKSKLDDFLGDPNFAGEDLRCMYMSVNHLNGDMRYMWWQCCHEASHGFHKRLLIGPKGSGKTRLVEILASLNDAMMFELDPLNLQTDLLSPVYLRQIIKAVASCAKFLQPSVIHIKNFQELFYSKVRNDGSDSNLDLIKQYIIKRLFKRFHRTDKITVIGSCERPWVTKSKQLLKPFRSVYLLPKTSYSTIVQLLSNWVHINPVIPKELNVSSLAYYLQGYTYGYLKKSLQGFLTPERIIRIAAYGLSTEELYELLVGNQEESKPNHEKYLKWYAENTVWGIKQKKHIEQQQEFEMTLKKIAEKDKRKFTIAISSSNSNSKIDNLNY